MENIIKPSQKHEHKAKQLRISQSLKDLKKQKSFLSSKPSTPETKSKIKDVNMKLNDIYRSNERLSRISRLREAIDSGEDLNPNFYKLFKSQVSRDNDIRMIKTDKNETIFDQSKINDFFINEFKDLLTNKSNSKSPTKDEINNFLTNSCSVLKDKLTPKQDTNTDLQVSQFEVQKAINKLKNKSSPGPDGISSALVKYLFKLIPNIITNAIKNEISNKPHNIPNSRVRERKIIVIKKKNYLSKLGFSAYRPISLLNSFYKAISNLLTSRVTGHIIENNLIPKSSLAYLMNRSGAEGVRFISDYI